MHFRIPANQVFRQVLDGPFCYIKYGPYYMGQRFSNRLALNSRGLSSECNLSGTFVHGNGHDYTMIITNTIHIVGMTFWLHHS